MKCKIQRYLSIIVACCLLNHTTTHTMSSAFKVVQKGVEIAGHIATAVDTAMQIANVGVSLWGNDTDKARMAKGMGITSIVTSLVKGDIHGAQAAADTIKGAPTNQVYQPLLADELADADIVPVDVDESTVRRTRSLGDVTIIPSLERNALTAERKEFSVNDLQVLKFPDKPDDKQLALLLTQIPQEAQKSKIYKLPNGIEILFTTKTIENNIATIVIKRMTGPQRAVEIGSCKSALDQLKKGLFIGYTNGELSIFFKEGNLIKKTILIENMNLTPLQLEQAYSVKANQALRR
jgi:hypothetical protein